jgi:hypothetical protein
VHEATNGGLAIHIRCEHRLLGSCELHQYLTQFTFHVLISTDKTLLGTVDMEN